jgi:sorbitol-specific phosphotransferase system component IIC
MQLFNESGDTFGKSGTCGQGSGVVELGIKVLLVDAFLLEFVRRHRVEYSAEHCVEEAMQEMIGNDIMFCQLS